MPPRNKLDIVEIKDNNNIPRSLLLKLSQSIKATRIYRVKQFKQQILDTKLPFSQIKLSLTKGFFPIPCDERRKKTDIIYESFLHIFTEKNELEHIDMRLCDFTDDQLLTLFKLIKRDKITYLDISGVKITHELAILLSDIAQTSRMKQFIFSNVKCLDSDFCILLESMKFLQIIDQFVYDIKSENIVNQDPQKICKIINESPNIKRITIKLNASSPATYPSNQRAFEFCRHIITDNQHIKEIVLSKSYKKQTHDRFNIHYDHTYLIIYKTVHDDLCLILDLLKHNNTIEKFELISGVVLFNHSEGSEQMETAVQQLYQNNGRITLINFPCGYNKPYARVPGWSNPRYSYQHFYSNGNERNRINNCKRNTTLLSNMYTFIKQDRFYWFDNEQQISLKRTKRAEYNKKRVANKVARKE